MNILKPLARTLVLALAFLCTAAAPPPDVDPILIEDVVYVWIVPMQYNIPLVDDQEFPRQVQQELEAFLLHADGSTTLLDLSGLVSVEMLQASPITANLYYLSNQKLETCWLSGASIMRKVITTCGSWTPTVCVKKHKVMVEAMLAQFPKTADCP